MEILDEVIIKFRELTKDCNLTKNSIIIPELQIEFPLCNFDEIQIDLKYMVLLPKELKIIDWAIYEPEDIMGITYEAKWSNNLPKSQNEEPKPIHD